MTVVLAPFKSQYGFNSPNFSVDANGNITATSITVSNVVEDVISSAADFKFTEQGAAFRFVQTPGSNPGITLKRNKTYQIELTLTNLSYSIYSQITPTLTLYSSGLRHTDGTAGANSQAKTSGILYIDVGLTAPNTLYYGNSDGTIFGTITVEDPEGLFSTVDINGITQSTSPTTGAVTIAGGVGIEKNLNVGENLSILGAATIIGALTTTELNVNGIGIPKLESPSNLELIAGNKIIFKVEDVVIGTMTSSGFENVTLKSSTINTSSIDNSIIGATTPATATFSSAIVNAVTATSNSVTNKNYVDSTATALAVAFGI
tara:strand:+ start:26437 stop:27390 length:954 start_codon:yes stop_codon:yes gene_type:complete